MTDLDLTPPHVIKNMTSKDPPTFFGCLRNTWIAPNVYEMEWLPASDSAHGYHVEQHEYEFVHYAWAFGKGKHRDDIF